MAIINHTLNKYNMLFWIYLDLLPLNLVYFVLEMSWKIIFPWLWEPCHSYRAEDGPHCKDDSIIVALIDGLFGEHYFP